MFSDNIEKCLITGVKPLYLNARVTIGTEENNETNEKTLKSCYTLMRQQCDIKFSQRCL